MSARFPVSKLKEDRLAERMAALEIVEDDLVEKFIRGSGKGGQKINKTSSCVYLLHRPSGIEIKCQYDRSQALNRYLARVELCDKLEAKVAGIASRQEQERERIRRQKRKRSKRAKEKMLGQKRLRSSIKSGRKRVDSGDGE